MLRIKRNALTVLILFAMCFVCPQLLWAADDDIASGTSGTCTWVISADSTLTISPTEGNSGTLGSWNFFSGSPWYNSRTSIKKVIFEHEIIAQTCHSLFYGCSDMSEIENIENLNTSNVTNMSWMFENCSSLASLDVTNFDTSNVTNMSCMFENCSSLATLDVTNFDTSNVTDMSWMFYKCSSLTSLDVTNFDTSNVTNMKSMFNGCSSLTSLDVTNFNTFNVTNMEGMFFLCSSLTCLDVTNFNTFNVTNMGGMFSSCSSLTSLDVTNFNTSNVANMKSMFYYCSSLTSLDVSNFNTSNVSDMTDMFHYCKSLTSLDVSNFNTSKVTTMNKMFYRCSSLTSLDVSEFNTSNVTDMFYMFGSCNKMTKLDLTSFDLSNVDASRLTGFISLTFKLCSIYLPYDEDDLNKLATIIDSRFQCASDDLCTIYCPTSKKLLYASSLQSSLGTNYPYKIENNYRLAGDIYDSDATIPNWEYAASEIRYIRTNTNKWGTIVLPYAVAASDDFIFYNATSVKSGSKTSLVVEPVETVSANTPYVYSYNGTSTNGIIFTNKEAITVDADNNINESTPIDVTIGTTSATLKAAYTSTVVTTDGGTAAGKSYYYFASSKLKHATGKLTVPAFRAWIEVDKNTTSAKEMDIVIGDDEVTGIETISDIPTNQNGNVYNLNGQRLSSSVKGQINIINGKKMIMK